MGKSLYEYAFHFLAAAISVPDNVPFIISLKRQCCTLTSHLCRLLAAICGILTNTAITAMSLDPKSPDFDPLLALYSVDVEDVPEGVTVYDNVATFESSVQVITHGVTVSEFHLPIVYSCVVSKQCYCLQNEPGTSKKRDKSFSKKKKVIEEAKNRDLGKLKDLMTIRKQLDESKSSRCAGVLKILDLHLAKSYFS